jgi:hypothetical protein
MGGVGEVGAGSALPGEAPLHARERGVVEGHRTPRATALPVHAVVPDDQRAEGGHRHGEPAAGELPRAEGGRGDGDARREGSQPQAGHPGICPVEPRHPGLSGVEAARDLHAMIRHGVR